MSYRLVLLLILSIGLGLAGGFLYGRTEDKVLVSSGLKPPKIRVLIQQNKLFPENLRAILEKDSGLQIEVDAFETPKSLIEMIPYFDVFLGPTCLMEAVDFESEDLDKSVAFEKLISPDFMTIHRRQNFVIPLLWHFDEGQGFQVISMRVKKTQQDHIRKLVKFWMRKSFIQKWSETTDLSTSFMTLDESSLEPELKASWIRNIPLAKLSLLSQTNCQTSKDNPAED